MAGQPPNGLFAIAIGKGVDFRTAPTVEVRLEVDGVGLLITELSSEDLVKVLGGVNLPCRVVITDV